LRGRYKRAFRGFGGEVRRIIKNKQDEINRRGSIPKQGSVGQGDQVINDYGAPTSDFPGKKRCNSDTSLGRPGEGCPRRIPSTDDGPSKEETKAFDGQIHFT